MTSGAPNRVSFLARIARWPAFLVPGVPAGAALCLAGYLASAAFVEVPAYRRVVSSPPTSEARLLDRHGTPLQLLRLDPNRRQLDWIPLREVSPRLIESLVAAEDRHFYAHHGIDLLAVLASVVQALRGDARGASTISMQLAALLSEQSHLDRQRHPLRKVVQMRDALALERSWSKEEILEAYLNLLPFRNDLVGVDAAARGLLGVGPGGLDDAQSAVLTALVRAPSARRTLVARRACGVLRRLGKDAACEDAEFIATGLPAIPRAISRADLNDAPHLAHQLLQAPGQSLRSTLDAGLQRFANETLRARLAELEEQNVEDGALVVLDNRYGDVLAYVGSSASLSRAGDVDGVIAKRQPGSTLKPFLYAQAIERGWLTAASLLQDVPFATDTSGGLYAPQDYEHDYKGPVSVRTALASSLNVPAIRALELVGVGRFVERLHDLGFASLTLDPQHYGVGLALGDGEVSLLELANAYRTLANGGLWSPTRLSMDAAAPAPAHRVFSPATSFIIDDILSDNAARAPTFGFASPLQTHFWAAVKTGTSKGMRDNWTVGFTDRYTIAVWVGNSSGDPMWDVSGVTGAAPIWQALVEYLHEGAPSKAPAPPRGLERQRVEFADRVEAEREEWFLPGTKLARIDIPSPQVHPQLLEPSDGTRIAPDPDIPAARQRIRIRANLAGDTNRCLRLDGTLLDRCGNLDLLSALPAPGEHRIALTDHEGTVLSEIRIDVRAARKPGAKGERPGPSS